MGRGSLDSFAGRAVGVIVFLVGIGVLGFVFVVAYRMFTSPVTIGATVANAASVTAGIAALIARIVLLFVMILVGSLVAGKGVQMYAVLHGPRATESERKVDRGE